jgi:hypothetical protein
MVIGSDLSIDLVNHYAASGAIIFFTKKMAAWLLDRVDDKSRQAQSYEMVNSMGFD